MPTNPQPTIRKILTDSHIAAIAIAVLLLWALDEAFRALWIPFFQLVQYLVTAVLILDAPYFNVGLNRMFVSDSCLYLLAAVADFCAACFFSYWVFGTGPLPVLTSYRTRIGGRNDA